MWHLALWMDTGSIDLNLGIWLPGFLYGSLSDLLQVLSRLIFFFQIVEEAGGKVSRMDGGKFTVFDRSVLVSNGHLHNQVK